MIVCFFPKGFRHNDYLISKEEIHYYNMANNVFPEIICLDGRWFLRYISGGEIVKEICLPNQPMMNRIWETASNLLNVYVDDCGQNLDRCVEVLRESATAFLGISQLLADEANDLQKEIELDRLYAPDPDEPWYNK